MVGRNGRHATVAVAAAKDGDTVGVAADTYLDDFAMAARASSGLAVMPGNTAAVRPPVPTVAPILSGSMAMQDGQTGTVADGTLGTTDAVAGSYAISPVTVAHKAIVPGAIVQEAGLARFTQAGVPGGAEAARPDRGANLVVANSLVADNQVATTGAGATVGGRDPGLARNGAPDGASGTVQVAGIDALTPDGHVHDALAGTEVSGGAAGVPLPDGAQVAVTASATGMGTSAQDTPLVQVDGGTAATGTTALGEGSVVVSNGAATGAATATGAAVNTASPWTNGVSASGVSTAPANNLVAAAATAGAAERGVLVLDVSGAAFQGNAQFQVLVDGVAVGGTLTAQASHAAGQSQAFSIGGTYAAGTHTVQVRFVNALAGADGAAGRELFIDGAQFNSVPVAGATAALAANGTATMFTGAPVAVPTAVAVNLSEDAWHGDAEALITVDGKVQNGLQTVTASHAAGQTEAMRFLLDLLPGAHTVGVTFVNDASGAGGDRNLYVDSVDVAGQHYPGAAASLLTGGTSTYAFTTAPAPAADNAGLFVRSGLAGAASLIVPTS